MTYSNPWLRMKQAEMLHRAALLAEDRPAGGRRHTDGCYIYGPRPDPEAMEKRLKKMGLDPDNLVPALKRQHRVSGGAGYYWVECWAYPHPHVPGEWMAFSSRRDGKIWGNTYPNRASEFYFTTQV